MKNGITHFFTSRINIDEKNNRSHTPKQQNMYNINLAFMNPDLSFEKTL